jgi:CRP-like cAMP-binding protein
LDFSNVAEGHAMLPTALRGGGAINALIASLSARDRRTVLKSCEEVDLALGDVLCAPGAPIRHIYFPVTSYISLITPKDVVDSLEVGLIGREGVFGITVLLGPMAVWITAGLDDRFHWSNGMSSSAFTAGLTAAVLAAALIAWAMRSNRFFSSVVRIQTSGDT